VREQSAQHPDIGDVRRGRQQPAGRRGEADQRDGVGALLRDRERSCRRRDFGDGDVGRDQEVAGQPTFLV
jgi:hypothetical protein